MQSCFLRSFVVGSFAVAQRASALTLVENISQPSAPIADNVRAVVWRASSFTTGSDSYRVDSATLLFFQDVPGQNLFVSLYTDDSGEPGTRLFDFSTPASISSIPSEVTFSLSSPQLLGVNSTYWLVAGVSSGPGDCRWDYTSSNDQTGLPGWAIGPQYLYSESQGGSWSGGAGPNQFRINGSPASSVPAPLPVLGAVAFWRSARKLRSASKSSRDCG